MTVTRAYITTEVHPSHPAAQRAQQLKQISPHTQPWQHQHPLLGDLVRIPAPEPPLASHAAAPVAPDLPEHVEDGPASAIEDILDLTASAQEDVEEGPVSDPEGILNGPASSPAPASQASAPCTPQPPPADHPSDLLLPNGSRGYSTLHPPALLISGFSVNVTQRLPASPLAAGSISQLMAPPVGCGSRSSMPSLSNTPRLVLTRGRPLTARHHSPTGATARPSSSSPLRPTSQCRRPGAMDTGDFEVPGCMAVQWPP
jgi:hypothetical protein